jgi:DNA-binding response OmpR family regulator
VRVTWLPPEEEGIIVPRVLVVDDDPMVCVAIEVCLTRKGFEVTVADGGEAGMRALEAADLGAACCLRKPFTPDALLTSVNQCITTPKASARHSK